MTEIFVFGANLAGRHGRGAALEARQRHGAQLGVGHGRTGRSYAIPTKDANLLTLPLHKIRMYVQAFLVYAAEHPDLTFRLTPIGCGLAGYRPEEIAPMFRGAPANVDIPPAFKPFLK